jgi:MtN3 and saliva related transmembrane protein
MEVPDLLGYTAALLTTASFVPQAWRTFRTKDVSGVSLRMYSIFTAGVAVWLAYGIALGETPMMIANGLTLVLACGVLVMKLRYRKPTPGSGAPTLLLGRRGRAVSGRTPVADADTGEVDHLAAQPARHGEHRHGENG